MPEPSSGSPLKELPPLRFPSQSSHRQKSSGFTALLIYLSLIPVKRAPFHVSQRSPYGDSWPFPEHYFTYPSDSRSKKDFTLIQNLTFLSTSPVQQHPSWSPKHRRKNNITGDFCLTLVNILVSGRFWKCPIPLCACRKSPSKYTVTAEIM